jgi:transcription initiation factor TFIID subunit 5
VRPPDSLGFPIEDIPNEIIEEEVKRLKEISIKSSTVSQVAPSASCFTLQNYGHLCSSVCFSPNFSSLCVGSSMSFIDVWSCSGTALRSLKPSTELAAYDLNSISSLDDILEEKGSYMKRLIGHSGPVSSVNMNRDGSAILSSSFDSSLKLWSTMTYSCLATYSSHAYPVWDSDLNPLGHYFASCSSDRTARLWNLDYSYPVRLFAGHLSDVDCVKFHPNGCYIATGGSDKSCRLWDISSGNCVRLFQGHNRAISSLSFSKNGKCLAVGDLSGRVYVYHIGEGRLIWKSDELGGRVSPVLSMDYSNDDKSLAVSYGDCKVKIYSPDDFDCRPFEYLTKQTPIFAARFNPRDILMCAGPFAPE